MCLLKITLFRYLIFLKIGSSSSATIMDGAPVERRTLWSVPSFKANWMLAQKQTKVLLSDLYTALIYIKFGQYRRYMYERAWNVASYSDRENTIYG